MVEGLNLTLPERSGQGRGNSKLLTVLLAAVLAAALANLAVSLLAGRGMEAPEQNGGFPAEAQKDLALKLENQGLRELAADAWREYLQGGPSGTEEQAKVWYRIGKLRQEAGQPERALEAYYRSESCAKVKELESEIGRRVQECLETAGKFSALRYELAERVGTGEGGGKAGADVLAEIGGHKISRAELDRRIEEQIERQMETFAAFLPEEERKLRKEEMVKRLASDPERSRLLEQLVLEEVLYRKAREDKLTDDSKVRAVLRDAERSLLARQVVDREMADRINITSGDLRTYYDAHKQEYRQPERAKISHILIKDETAAEELRGKLKDGAKFEDLAKERSLDEETKSKGGEIDPWIGRGEWAPGIGSSEEAGAAIFGTEAGKIADKTVKTDKGFHLIKVREREPEKQKDFSEVRGEVYRALRNQKESEVQSALMSRLRDRYSVVIHSSKLAPAAAAKEDEKPSGGQKSK